MDVSQFDQVTTAIMRKFEDSGKIGNQIFSADPLFAFLNAKGKKLVKGGREIQVNLRASKNTTGGSYSGWDPLDTTPMNTLAHAIFGWSNYSISIAVDGPTIEKASGNAEVIDLMADKMQEATDSLEELMTGHLWAAAPGNGGKDLLGIPPIVSATGTIGGIDRAAHPFFQAKALAHNAALTTAMMRKHINTVRGPSGDPQKTGKVDLIIMPADLYESFEGLYEEKLRVAQSDLTLGQLGFEALKFKGAEITWSNNCPAGCVYFLSSNYMGLRVMPSRDFALSDWRVPANQDGKVAFLWWMGQVITNDPAKLGVATGVTAAVAA